MISDPAADLVGDPVAVFLVIDLAREFPAGDRGPANFLAVSLVDFLVAEVAYSG
ncbi:MAG: hypothetical protein ABIN58_02810 [candidate division WOR-3 bacterium]